VLLTLGVLFQLDTLEILEFQDSWPLLIVAAGATIAWRSLREPAPPTRAQENHHV
jgi:hypothetical protein